MAHNPQNMQKKAKMTQDCKNVALKIAQNSPYIAQYYPLVRLKLPKTSLKLPKVSLIFKGYFGQFRGYILVQEMLEGFFASEGGSCHRGFTIVLSERPRSLLLFLGVPSRPSPGSDPGPVQVPSRVPSGPVQIRHVLSFAVFRTHPGPEVGAIPARPGPILVPSVSPRIGPGRAETDFLATSDSKTKGFIAKGGLFIQRRRTMVTLPSTGACTRGYRELA